MFSLAGAARVYRTIIPTVRARPTGSDL